jgi:hypothetical protein
MAKKAKGPKPYARIALTEEELRSLISAVSAARERVWKSYLATPDGDEREFYRQRVDANDALMKKLDEPLLKDTSQDAEEEPEEEDEEDDRG